MTEATRNAVVALLRLSLGRGGDPPAQTDALGSVAWEDLVALASAHVVLPQLHAGVIALDRAELVPADVAAFLASMHAANIERNRRLSTELSRVARAFNAIGITPLAMKGGAMLASAPATCSPARLMGDLDVLVPRDRIETCAQILVDAGYRRAYETYDDRNHHYPPLWSPCGRIAIELHTRVLQGRHNPLPLDVVLAEARRVEREGAHLLVPSDRHRIVHVLAHTGLNHHAFRRRRIILRDLVDLSTLSAQCDGGVDWRDVIAHFELPSHRTAARALLAAWSRLLGEPLPNVPIGAAEQIWLAQAMWGFQGSRWHNVSMLPIDLAIVLSQAGGLMKIIRSAGRPARAIDWAINYRRREQGHLPSGVPRSP
jgi:hypothetical protein